MPRSNGIADPGNDVKSQPPRRYDDKSNAPQVGAFPVAGMGEASSVHGSIFSRNNLTSFTQDSTSFPVICARVVDEEKPSLPVLIATPLDESQPTETQHLKALLNSRKCRIISTLAFTLFVGVIVGVVLLTKNGSNELSLPAKALLAEIKPLLSNESLTALDDPDSPQSLSLRWLLERSNFQAWPFHQQVQRYAMATIYYATGGPSWSNGGHWLTDASECEWFQGSEGDFCDGNQALLILSQNNNTLNGKIPDEIRFLSSLTTIDLSVNKLYRSIPTDSIGNIPSLQVLNLSMNEFSGHVPDDIVVLSSLTVIDLSANQLIGTIPVDLIRSITSLRVLDLSNNLFTGTLTSSLGELTALQEIDLSSNPLSNWPLPYEIGNLTKLTHLDLSNTKIINEIPTELGLLKALQYLHLGGNDMNGTLPTQIFDCTMLSALWLQYNSFSGTLPSEFGSLTALTDLYLDKNSFTGTVPSELGSLTALTLLTLDRNDLNGSVPTEVCNLGTVEIHTQCEHALQCNVSCCPVCWVWV
jgi:Leucine-rich repeat (LRR) protein